jgi:hypothetical protein
MVVLDFAPGQTADMIRTTTRRFAAENGNEVVCQRVRAALLHRRPA